MPIHIHFSGQGQGGAAGGVIGDPLAEELADDLSLLSPEEQGRLIEAGMNGDAEALKGAPASLRRFFDDAETPPEWLDFSAFDPGRRMFQRNSKLVLVGFVAGVLIEGFTRIHRWTPMDGVRTAEGGEGATGEMAWAPLG